MFQHLSPIIIVIVIGIGIGIGIWIGPNDHLHPNPNYNLNLSKNHKPNRKSTLNTEIVCSAPPPWAQLVV